MCCWTEQLCEFGGAGYRGREPETYQHSMCRYVFHANVATMLPSLHKEQQKKLVHARVVVG